MTDLIVGIAGRAESTAESGDECGNRCWCV